MALHVNEKAPDFTLNDQDGNEFSLRRQAGRRLLLVFDPGDGTPVCTRQLCEYRDGFEEFSDLGVELVGISPDDARSHRTFRDRHELPFTLLSDSNLEVARRYGCKALVGMKRGVFLIDEDQVIRYAHVEPLALFRRGKDELVQVIRQLA